MAVCHPPDLRVLSQRNGLALMRNHNRVPIFVSIQQSCMILPLWRQGHDTQIIATTLCIPEFEVFNRLLMLREQHRLNNEGQNNAQQRTLDLD
jgi:hypothetical protein